MKFESNGEAAKSLSKNLKNETVAMNFKVIMDDNDENVAMLMNFASKGVHITIDELQQELEMDEPVEGQTELIEE